jgi:hypothetical protein
MNVEKSIQFNDYLATAYAEGFGEGSDATFEEQILAWSYLIKTGLCWRLQGWFGRQAEHLIRMEMIDREGNISWEDVNDYINNQ